MVFMSHDHAHGPGYSELDETELRVRALQSLLTQKGYIDPAAGRFRRTGGAMNSRLLAALSGQPWGILPTITSDGNTGVASRRSLRRWRAAANPAESTAA